MKSITLTALAAVLFLTPFALAQDTKPKQDPQSREAGPAPGKEHEQLKLACGTWNTTIEHTGSPAAKGTAEFKSVLGGFWVEETFSCDFGGMMFEGRGLTGYDPVKGKFVATWVDNSNQMLVTEGTYDVKTRTLTMVGDGRDHGGNKVKVKMLTIHKDANTVVFEMHHTGADGKEMKVMTITYTRAGNAGGKPGK